MTSNPAPVDYSFTITSSDLERGRLNRPGKVRVDKIYTLAQSIAVRNFGKVGTHIVERIRGDIQSLTAAPSSRVP
jgi:mRNA interferase MazF